MCSGKKLVERTGSEASSCSVEGGQVPLGVHSPVQQAQGNQILSQQWDQPKGNLIYIMKLSKSTGICGTIISIGRSKK